MSDDVRICDDLIHVKHECSSCGGTGLYCGFAEPKGTGVVCFGCNGLGWSEATFKKFTGRKDRPGIATIQLSRGSLLATGVGPTGDSMTYDEFKSKYR